MVGTIRPESPQDGQKYLMISLPSAPAGPSAENPPDYVLVGGSPVACNPVNGGSACEALLLEDPEHFGRTCTYQDTDDRTGSEGGPKWVAAVTLLKGTKTNLLLVVGAWISA